MMKVNNVIQSCIVPFAEILSPKQPESPYAQTLEIHRGTAPIVLTVPHDGSQRTLGDMPLQPPATIVSNHRKRDMGMRYMLADIRDRMMEKSNSRAVPTTFLLRTQRAFRTPEIQAHFEQQVIQTIRYLSRSPHARMPLFLDLHGFGEQPGFRDDDGEPFDIILGTGHGRYVKPSGMDATFGSFLRERGYHVYVPGREPREGELFTAYHEPEEGQFLPLAQVVHASGLPTIPMQVEIAPEYRLPRQESTVKGKELASDIADFLLGYA